MEVIDTGCSLIILAVTKLGYNFNVANCEQWRKMVHLYGSDRYWMFTYNLGCDKIGGTKVVLLEELIEKVRKRRMLVNHERM